jgi:sec-independent protein translocase protein TatC
MADSGSVGRPSRFAFLRRRLSRRRQTTMTITEHLTELRKRLVIAVAAFGLISIIAFFFYTPILDFLLHPLCSIPKERLGPQGCDLIAQGPLEPFTTRLKVTAMVGFLFSSPVWLYQLWAFIVPGLNERERKYGIPFVASSVLLFALGATAAYFLMPRGLELLVGLGGRNVVPFFRAKEYLNFVGLTFIAFGLMFEVPLILLFLGLAGVLKSTQMRSHRRAAFVGIVFLSAVVTPSQDPYTMLGLALPIYVLYEVVALILSRVEKKRARA